LDSYMRRVRHKLEQVDGGEIATRRGVGYRWR
jgi:DNA-binding response OmpR family regulator